MKASKLIDVGSITEELLNPHLRRKFSSGGGTTVNNNINEPSNVPIYICRVVSTGNIHTDNATTAVDGITLVDGDAVLVAGQTVESENGIYYYSSITSWVRFTDIVPGMLVTIKEGTAEADTVWLLTSDNFVIGIDDIVFEKVLPVEAMPAGTLNNIIRHDGTGWAVANKVSLEDDGTNRILKFVNNANKERIGLYANNASSQIFVNTNTSGNYLSIDGSSDTPYIQLTKGTLLTNIAADTPNCIRISSGATTLFKVTNTGLITSNTLTANTYLGANASKEIVSVPSPNTILSNSADNTDAIGTFKDAPLLGFVPETNYTYELTFKLAFGDTATRNGSVRLYADGTNFTFRPFVLGNFGAGAPAVIYLNNYTAVQPFNMDNGTQLDFQLNGTYGVFELKGIFKTTTPIANLRLQYKTSDAPLPITLKGYSYLKITR